MVLGVISPVCYAQQTPPRAGGTENNKREQAKGIFDQGAAAERQGDYVRAIDFYNQGLALFPDEALLHYRIGMCRINLRQTQEAEQSLRAFLRSGYQGPEELDGRSRLQELLLPTLTPEQREKWKDAADCLEVAAMTQPLVKTIPKEPAQLRSLQNAVDLLSKLEKEVPKYLPIQARLGLAYQQMGEYEKAVGAYDKYIKEFEILKFAPPDLSETRKSKYMCKDMIILMRMRREEEERSRADEQRRMAQEQQRKAEERKAALRKLKATITEKRRYLEEHGSFTSNAPKIGRVNHNQALTFEGDTFVRTDHNDFGNRKKFKITVNISDIDINSLRIDELEINGIAWVWFNARSVRWEAWDKNSPSDPPVYSRGEETPVTMPLGFDAPNERAAKGLMDALRDLLDLSKQLVDMREAK